MSFIWYFSFASLPIYRIKRQHLGSSRIWNRLVFCIHLCIIKVQYQPSWCCELDIFGANGFAAFDHAQNEYACEPKLVWYQMRSGVVGIHIPHSLALDKQ